MDNGKHHFAVVVIVLVVVIVNSNDLFHRGFESFNSLHYIRHKKISSIEKCAARERTVREVGMDMYTQLYLKWVTNKDLLYSTWNSVNVLRQPGWERGWGRMDTCTCVAESLFSSPETIKASPINYVLCGA